jgi:copper chaperone NosL
VRPRLGIFWLVAAAGFLAGCDAGKSSRPPTLRWGEEACAYCRMIISDERFAAALVTESGDALKFDDIGCLIQHETDGLRSDVTYWVCSFHGPGWLDAKNAAFVRSTSIASPMGYGVAAMPTAEAANELAAGPASRILSLPDLPRFLAGSPREAASDLPKSQ